MEEYLKHVCGLCEGDIKKIKEEKVSIFISVFELIANKRWAKTAVPGKKKNTWASHMTRARLESER